MNRSEIVEILNNLYLIYPRMFEKLEDPKRMDMYVLKYSKYFQGLQHDDIMNGIDRYVLSDKGNYNPSVKDIVNYAKAEQKKREHKEGIGTRQIETDDEVRYNIYLQEINKEPSKRNETLIRMCMESARIMTEPGAFEKKYGKTREEYERY